MHSRVFTNLSFFDRFLLNKVDKIIVISKAIKTNFNQIDSLNNKIHVIYNGVEVSDKTKKISEEDEIIIGYVGRLVKWKGVETLIRAAERLNLSKSKIKIIIAGDGTDKERLINLAKNNSTYSNIEFLGNVKDIAKIYSSLDIFVHTAIEPEPFGRVLIEAMSFKLPIISTNIGGPTEIITKGYDGYLTTPGDYNELADKILYLIENEELRVVLGNNAYKTVKDKFSIINTTKKIEELYENIIKKDYLENENFIS